MTACSFSLAMDPVCPAKEVLTISCHYQITVTVELQISPSPLLAYCDMTCGEAYWLCQLKVISMVTNCLVN